MKRKLFFLFWWWYLSLGWVTTAYCLGKDPKLMKITQFSVLKVDLTFGQENTVQFVSKWLCKEVVVLCGSAEVSQTWSHHYLRQLSRTSRAEDRNSPCNDDYGTKTYQLSQKLTHFSKPLFKVSVVTREKSRVAIWVAFDLCGDRQKKVIHCPASWPKTSLAYFARRVEHEF